MKRGKTFRVNLRLGFVCSTAVMYRVLASSSRVGRLLFAVYFFLPSTNYPSFLGV